MNRGETDHPGARPSPGGARSLGGLLAVLFLSAIIIGSAWRYSRQAIANHAAERTLVEISTVLPPGLYDNEPHKDVVALDTGGGQPLAVYRARRNGQPVAAVLTIDAPDGYLGPIRLLVGIAADGTALGVHVQSHSETPGIGAAVAADHSPWIAGFAGRSLGAPAESRWALRGDGGDFDAIAGATVSSRAVVGGVRRAMQYFAAHRAEIFGGSVAAPPVP